MCLRWATASRWRTRSRASIRRAGGTAATATSAPSAASPSRRWRSTTSPSTRGPDGGSRAYVAPISFGLGDLVVSLPAIQALIERGRAQGVETRLVARSEAQAGLAVRIAGLTGWVHEESFDRHDHDGRFVDLRDHPLQRDWWWGSPEF